MEHSLSALTYKGAIPGAILESKNQKKLFVVYISGSDAKSVELENFTWTDSKVAESVSKFCILLHITEGSADAANFSAIYPQKSIPSIAAIGYNGVQLWQSEGFVSSEVLATSLEKAWLSLHIRVHMQETTATVLTAAVAAKKSELSTAGSSDVGMSGQENSSSTVVPSPSVDKQVEFSESDARAPVPSIEEITSDEHTVEENSTKFDDHASSKSSVADNSLSTVGEQSTCSTEEAKGLPRPLMLEPDNSVAGGISSRAGDDHPAQKIINHHSDVPCRDSQLDTSETHEAVLDETEDHVDDRKAETLDTKKRVNASSDVHLNIRLPSGVSLQDKFSVTSTLRMVKDYVDRKQEGGIGSYDLAIPYPRKVFSNEDLSKSLSELGLFSRQALIVVPHQRATSNHRGGSSSDQTSTGYSDSSIVNNGGYFAYIKSMLSYINPLSYVGGSTSSSSSRQAQRGMWEYSPNPALQNNLARTQRPYPSSSPNQSTSAAGRNDSSGRQPPSSSFGSNIHTLKHDEDDSQFGDRNPFWNGNSTQYGGNSDGK